MSGMKRKTLVFLVLITLAAVLLGSSCVFVVSQSSTEPSGNGSQYNTDLKTVQDAWTYIFRDYVEQDKLDSTRLSEAAIQSMIEALDDPYTTYLNPERYKLTTSSFQGSFAGIGAQVESKDSQIVIVAPIPGSPAEAAGIKSGDIILEINGQSTAGLTLTEAVLIIRGPVGTSVSLLIQRENESTPVKIDVVRAEISVNSVTFEMKGDIAYIRISSFSEKTGSEMNAVIEQINSNGAAGIILDLRNNPGGMLQTTVETASNFLKEGVVVDVRDNKGRHTSTNVISGRPTTDLPMVVLVNELSASGSEVLTGALQDYGRATVAGTITFGKGSVNVLHELSGGAGLYITIARWLTPKGRLIEGMGLQPDVTLELTGDEAIHWAIDYLKTHNIGTSPVLVPVNVG